MIKEILDILKRGDYYGAGEHVEISKGKHEIVTTWKGLKRKATRIWQS